MKTKVEPKLKFEVGEKVVITGYSYSLWNSSVWPNENDFTTTTITKVNDDGSVEVEGGYVYRQSYKTEYGFTEVHNYFRIRRIPSNSGYTKFNSKRYSCSGYDLEHCEVQDSAWFNDVTFLFKLTKEFEDKMIAYQERFDKAQVEKAEAEKKYEEKEAKRKPHLDAFRDFMEPLEKKFYEEKCKAWKELVCAHCKHNFGGKCSIWKDENHSWQDIETMEVSSCSAFEGR